MELPSEAAVCWWRKAGELSASGSTAHTSSTAHPKIFNLSTYKLHALGDYVNTIRLFGTTDSYTTQIISHFKLLLVVSCQINHLPLQGELSHQRVKKFYQCTNKQEPAGQIAKQERRYTRVRRQYSSYVDAEDDTDPQNNTTPVSLEPHHRLSNSPINTFNLAEFLQSWPDDPALQVSLAK